MNEKSEDHLQNVRNSFQKVLDFGLQVSLELNGKPATDQSALASIVHTKMCVTGASIQHVFTAALADHSAIIALCRMVMESATFYFYLMEPVEKNEWDCRYLCLRLHDTTNRIKFLRGFQSDNEYADLVQGRDALVKELKENAYFKTLSQERTTKLLSGEHFFVRGVNQAAEKAMGWNFRKYLALYSYYSAHAHSAPMSFFRVRQQKVSFSDPSAAQRDAVASALSVAEYCLLKTTLNYLDSAPDSRTKFDAKELQEHRKELVGWRNHFEAKL